MKALWHLAGGRTCVDIGNGRFTGLDLKTGGAFGAARWLLRKARGVIAKLASRRSEVVKTPCPSDAPSGRWTKMPLGELSLAVVEYE